MLGMKCFYNLYLLICNSVHTYHFVSLCSIWHRQSVFRITVVIDDAMETRQSRGDAHMLESADCWMDTYWLLSQTTKANFKCVCVWDRLRKIEQAKGQRAQYESQSIWVRFSQLVVKHDFRGFTTALQPARTHTRCPACRYNTHFTFTSLFPSQTCEPAQTTNVCSAVCASTNTNGSNLSQTQAHTCTHAQDVNGDHPVICHRREAHPSISTFLSSAEVNGLELYGYIRRFGSTSSCPIVSVFLALTSSQSSSSHSKTFSLPEVIKKWISKNITSKTESERKCWLTQILGCLGFSDGDAF